jgi:hypothetical protein
MEIIKKNDGQGTEQVSTAKMGNKNVLNGLKVRTITAKLRDAVIISLNDEGGEMARFKNIELPEALRDLPVADYQFTKTIEGKLEFELHFKAGILPKPMPEARPKVTRAEKAAAKAEEADPKKEAPKVEPELPKASAIEAKKPEVSADEALKAAETPKPPQVEAKKPDAPALPIIAPKAAGAKEEKKPEAPKQEPAKAKPEPLKSAMIPAPAKTPVVAAKTPITPPVAATPKDGNKK